MRALRRCVPIVLLLAVICLWGGAARAAPYGWPVGWSEVAVLGKASRFSQDLAVCIDGEGRSIHLAWLEDHEQGVGIRYGCLGPGEAHLQAEWVWREPGEAREVALAAVPGVVHIVFTARVGSMTRLYYAAAEAGSGFRVRPVAETPLTMISPRVAVFRNLVRLVWCDSSGGKLALRGSTIDGGRIGEPTWLHVPSEPCVLSQLAVGREPWVFWAERKVANYHSLHGRPLAGGEPRKLLDYYAPDGGESFSVAATPSGGFWVVLVGSPAEEPSRREGLWFIEVDESGCCLRDPWLVQGGKCLNPQIMALPGEGATLAWGRAEGRPARAMCYFLPDVRSKQPVALTRHLPGCFYPAVARDRDGHHHFLALSVDRQGAYDVVYMHTKAGARITRWNLVGLTEGHVLVGIPLRLASVLALGLMQTLVNVGLLIGSLVLVFALSRLRVVSAEPRWITLSVLMGVWVAVLRLWAPSVFVELLSRPAGLRDDLVAVVLASCLSTGFWAWRRPRGRAHDVLELTIALAAWLFWYFSLGLARTNPW
ncbi:MAG: hypothetical protein AB1446_12015 [Bacillota bacterium]